MKLPIVASDGNIADISLELIGCDIVCGKRYILFEVSYIHKNKFVRRNARIPLTVLLEWESMRDAAIMKLLGVETLTELPLG